MITRITLGLAIAAALPLAAQAHDAHGAAPASLPVGEAAAPADAIVVVRDAETGKLRLATPEEHAALKALPAPALKARVASRSTTAVTPQLKQHSSGAVGVRLTDEMVSQSVIVRRADGTLHEVCVATKDEADTFLKTAGASSKSALPTE